MVAQPPANFWIAFSVLVFALRLTEARPEVAGEYASPEETIQESCFGAFAICQSIQVISSWNACLLGYSKTDVVLSRRK